LARRDHSEAEIRRALGREGHPEPDVEAALDRLRAERYLDDAAYAARFARSRLAHQGLGQRRIRAALGQRGVARTAVERGIREALEEVSEADTLTALARKYWRERTQDQPEQRLRKLWSFLLRRGFSPDLVRERLRTLWPRHRGALDELLAAEEENE